MDARARRCPYCGQWRGGPTLVLILMQLLWIAPLLLVQAVLYFRFQPVLGRDAGVPYRDQIEVTQSEMFFGQSKDGLTVSVVGMLKNRGDVTWREIGVEVQFTDPDGRIIDVEADEHYLSRILPHGEMAFKLRTMAELPADRYASYKVFVRSAEDARSPW